MNQKEPRIKTDGSIDRIHTAIESHKPALMPYFPVGYPDFETSLAINRCLCENGGNLIELGIPFSDPLADGTVIQGATQSALRNGTSIKDCLRAAERLREIGATTPAVFMSYYNPIFHYGVSEFVAACVDVHVDGLIIPDLPPEESDDLRNACRKWDLATIFLLTPNTPEPRIRRISEYSTGFLYLVSVLGTTGAREEVPTYLPEFVERVRRFSHLNLAVGFGISQPEQAAEVGGYADGIIIGSALVERVRRALATGEDAEEAAGSYLTQLSNALHPKIEQP